MSLYKRLIDICTTRGAGYLVLIDPDCDTIERTVSFARICERCGVDGLLIGGSLIVSDKLNRLVKEIKNSVSIPLILFPGSGRQLSPLADGLLFLSLLSGRNPQYLIGEQVMSAMLIKSMNLEAISTAYLLIESGGVTAVEYISDTKPLPRNKPDIAAAHAVAAEYMGMKFVYLEAGSGAENSVPESIISAVAREVSIPVIVGGGIRDPDTAREKVNAGASFVVTGNILEKSRDEALIRSFASAIHKSG